MAIYGDFPVSTRAAEAYIVVPMAIPLVELVSKTRSVSVHEMIDPTCNENAWCEGTFEREIEITLPVDPKIVVPNRFP